MIEAAIIHRHCSSTYRGHLCAAMCTSELLSLHVSDRRSHHSQTLLFHIESPMCTYVHLCAFIRAAATHANKVSLSRKGSSQVCWDWLSLQAASKQRQEVKPARSFLFFEVTVKFTGEWQSVDSHGPEGGPLCLPGRPAGWLPQTTFSFGY